MDMNVAAVVVLYNPSQGNIEVIYETLVSQVKHTVFVDNSDKSTSLKNLEIISNLYGRIAHNYTLIQNNKNLGIAEAQNIGVEFCEKMGIEYVVFSDQDTDFPEGAIGKLIEALKELEKSGNKVGAVGPLYANVNDDTPDLYFPVLKDGKINKLRVLDKACDVSFIIASGMVTRVDTFYSVGPNRSDFFIDWVDIEWCLRAQQRGYKIYGLPSVKLNHKLGENTKRFLGRNIVIHGPFRTYFKIRNAIFMYRLRHALDTKDNAIWFLKFVSREIIFTLLFQNSRLKNLSAIGRGIRDGLFLKLADQTKI
jgi:rhamnosyltransferase